MTRRLLITARRASRKPKRLPRYWVRSEDLSTAWQKPHLRTPGYIFGKAGTVERLCGTFDNPELLSIGLAAAPQPLYRAPRPGIFS